MKSKHIKAVILAAGQSKRMKSAKSKVLHKILGKEIINIVIEQVILSDIAPENIIVIVGNNNSDIKAKITHPVQFAIQSEQLGTAHALLSAENYFRDFSGHLLVIVGDNPYITAAEIKKLTDHHLTTQAACTLLSAVFPDTPPPYGRILRNQQQQMTGIVEQLDATSDQLQIREVNSSIYLFHNPITYPLLKQINNNNVKGEYYLTDIIQLLHQNNQLLEAVIADDYTISIGINNRWELQEAQQRFNQANIKKLSMEQGITFLQPETTTIEWDVRIGQDTIIYPCTYIGNGTRIGKNCQIGPFVHLKKAIIKDNEIIRQCTSA
jgi:bifunctional UDP-N-acetylglucosamine pyrophosphorylase/glucosamine-1-phosphate N-acetyltransferase